MAGFTAGTISYYGLVRFFGNSSERKTGIMSVSNLSEWQSKTAGASAFAWTGVGTSNPPADGTTLAPEWWSVWNYLQYGVGGCVVGATGTDQNIQFGYTYSALHESPETINVFFNAGNTFSSGVVANIAATRADTFAVIGAIKGITLPVSDTYNSHPADFGIDGFTGNTGANVIYVANRKNYFRDWNNSGVGSLQIGKIDLSSDVAGCFGRSYANTNSWSVPAGIKRGAINGAISLEQSLGASDQTNLLNNGVSPVISFPGRGAYFMGNSTGAASAGSTASRANTHIVGILNYIKAEVKNIAYDYMFEPNTDGNRTQFVSRANSLMDTVKSSGSITAYSVICNASNNTGITFTADIAITPVNVAEAITLRVTNNGSTPAEVYIL